MSSQKLTQTQKMLQKLSPQQILLMKLLQIPTMELVSRIKEELEENPALEEKDNFDDDLIIDDDEDSFNERQNNDDEEYDPLSDFDDYMQDDDDDAAAYKLRTNNYSRDDERYEAPLSDEESFQELLIQQLGYRKLDDRKYKIGTYIIGNLDESGYLSRPISGIMDDLLFTQNIDVTEEEVIEVLHIIQDFDPSGIGARNLQECLLIQLHRLEEDNEDDIDYSIPITIIEHYFNEFTKKHYDKIIKKIGISERQFRGALNEILKLNPKPGGSIGDSQHSSNYVIPDFTIYNNCGNLEVTINSRNTPDLYINKDYTDMLADFSNQKTGKSNKEAVNFVRNKIDSAKWFIEAIKQRHNTLYLTMKAIMDYQKEYFLSGDETKLKPMILKDISEIVNLDISTISRVVNSKYVQTAFGTFPLKSFFSEALINDDGEEVSTREIKKILMDCIEQEDKSKPLTDDILTQILKEKGYNIARRTIAKYREQLDIPVARLRKEL